MRGTPEMVPLPPFYGMTPPGLNGQHPAAEEVFSTPAVEAAIEPTIEAAVESGQPDSGIEPLAGFAEDLEPAGDFTQDIAAAEAFASDFDAVSDFAQNLEQLEPAAEFVALPIDLPAEEPVAEFAPQSNQMPTEEPASELAWDTTDGEGVVEPAFEEDVHATEEMLADSARSAQEFPMDAFIIPEHTSRLPTGVADEEGAEADEDGATAEIAARFEEISKLLREEDVNELLVRLARGDRLDALLAGFLAGYLSTHDA